MKSKAILFGASRAIWESRKNVALLFLGHQIICEQFCVKKDQPELKNKAQHYFDHLQEKNILKQQGAISEHIKSAKTEHIFHVSMSWSLTDRKIFLNFMILLNSWFHILVNVFVTYLNQKRTKNSSYFFIFMNYDLWIALLMNLRWCQNWRLWKSSILLQL